MGLEGIAAVLATIREPAASRGGKVCSVLQTVSFRGCPERKEGYQWWLLDLHPCAGSQSSHQDGSFPGLQSVGRRRKGKLNSNIYALGATTDH